MIKEYGKVIVNPDGQVEVTKFTFEGIDLPTGGLYALAWAKERIEAAQAELRKNRSAV
jgi:hypothetical protein